MSYSIKVINTFKRQLKRLGRKYHSLKKDYADLLDSLLKNPLQGADLGGGVHKVRMAISDKNKGRSHGARVITYVVQVDEATGTIYLLSIYDKEEQSTISKKDIALLMKEI